MLTAKLRSAIEWHLGHATEATRNIERLTMTKVTRDALFDESGPVRTDLGPTLAYSFSTPFGSVPIELDEGLPDDIVAFWSHGKPVVRARIS